MVPPLLRSNARPGGVSRARADRSADRARVSSALRRPGSVRLLHLAALLFTASPAGEWNRAPCIPARVVPDERLRPGEPVEGSLSGDEAPLPERGPARRFEFAPDAAGVFTVSLDSLAFDAFLRVEGEGGGTVAEDDNGGIETNARLVFRAAAGARYRIVAAAAVPGRAAGGFRLTVAAGEVPRLGGGELLDAAIAFRSAAAAEALKKGDTAGACLHRLAEGDRRFARWQFREAKGAYSQALALAREGKDSTALSRALGGAGISHSNLGEFAEARPLLEEYLDLARARRERREEAWALGSLGNVAYGVGDYAVARERYQGQLDLARQLGEKAEQAKAIENLGLVARAVGEATKAREHYEAALSLLQDLEDRRGEAKILGRLGSLHNELGDPEKARALHERQLALAKDLGEEAEAAFALGGLGAVAESLGEIDQARSRYTERLERARAIGDPPLQAEALRLLANLEEFSGSPARARELHRQRLELARQIGDQATETRALGGIAETSFSLGDYAEAADYNARRLEQARKLGMKPEEIAGLTLDGFLHQTFGDLQLARACHERCLDESRRQGDRIGEANALINLGATLSVAGEAKDARLEAARAIFRDLGIPRGEAAVLVNLGGVVDDLGEPALAEESLLAAREIFQGEGDKGGEAGPLARLASFSLSRGDLPRARDFARQARAIRMETGPEESLLLPLRVLARVALSEGDASTAEGLLGEAHRLFDRPSARRLATGEASGWRSNYALWSEIAQDLTALRSAGAPEGMARAWSEGFRNEGRWKGHALLEGIAEHRQGARSREAMALRREVREILAERDRLLEVVSGSIHEGRPAATIASLRVQADALLERAEGRERRLASISPRDATLDRPAGAEVEVVRRALGEGTALIEYAEGESRLYAYLLTRDRLEFLDLGPRQDVGKAIQAFLACVATPDSLCPAREVGERGRSLFATLLAPAIRAAGREPERLLIVPTATLASLPFEALVSGKPGKEEPRTFADLEFVLDRYEVGYAPSSPVVAELASVGPRRGPGKALVLADPLYRRERPAPAPGSRPSSGPAPDVAGWVDADLEALPALPSTRGEAEAIAHAWLGSEDPKSRAILDRLGKERSGSASSDRLDLHWGAEASRRPLEGVLRDYAVLHLAAHGFVNWRFPERTRIALSPDAEGRGRFTIADALELDLDAELVTLSACETAQGEYRRGEGVESLARAFLYAGARGVIASLWTVEDRAGAETMRGFYGRWRGSGSASRALLEAKRALRRSKDQSRGREAREGNRGVLGLAGSGDVDPAHPYFWAPFIYIGLPR